MIEYNDIKDLIVWNDPIFGNLSFDFIITGLQESIKKQIKFEDTVYHILKKLNIDDKTISSLFNLSQTNVIDMLLKMIKDEL